MVDNGDGTFAPAVATDAAPATVFEAITPHNSTNLTNVTRGIYVGVAGDVVVVPQTGSAVTFKNAAAGSILPVRAIRVNSTGTTATDLVGLS